MSGTGWDSVSPEESDTQKQKEFMKKIAEEVVKEAELTRVEREALPKVRVFKDLPDPKDNDGKVYIVQERRRLKPPGLYYCNGKKWKKRAKAVVVEAKSKIGGI